MTATTDPAVIEFMRRIPSRLRPNPAVIGPVLASAFGNGWQASDLLADALDRCRATTGPGAFVGILRELADAPRPASIPEALMEDALNPPCKWSWCRGCQSPWHWLDDHERAVGPLCAHHRQLSERIERAAA